MPEVEVEIKKGKLDKAKEVVRKNWKPFTVGVVFTGVTLVVTKRVSMQYMRIDGSSTFISRALANEGPLFKVFQIYTPGLKFQGPSWMVRCKETGKAFRSQRHAANVMGITESTLSQHLNGMRDHVHGYHYERIGIGV